MIEANSKNIFQIYLTDDDTQPVPAPLLECVKSVHSFRSTHAHFLLRGEELRSIIHDGFGDKVLRAYDKLVPYAYRADLGRYCLLYLFGGWYFDVSSRPAMDLPSFDEFDLIFFRDAPVSGRNSWGVHNGVFFARRGQECLLQCIEQIVKHCDEEFYGSDSLYVTGPGLLGRHICLTADIEKSIVGSYLPLTPMHYFKNYAFLLPRGHILAWGKSTAGTPEGGGLAGYGATGTNHYGQLFAERKIYDRAGD